MFVLIYRPHPVSSTTVLRIRIRISVKGRIRIRLRVKSRIRNRIRIKVKIKELWTEDRKGAVDVHNGGVEAQNEAVKALQDQ